MARIFITGSSDGLGAAAAKALSLRGHNVYVHGRNAQRAKDAEEHCPSADGAFIADLSSIEATKTLAAELNDKGPWDAIIHNAGVMGVSGQGKEGLPILFATNTLAPYILTCLVKPMPKRMVFLSSQLHHGGDSSLKNLKACGYGDSKLHNTMMAMAFARKYKDCEVSSLDPGWIATKMGGAGAPDSLDAAVDTYVMLAEGGNASGKHWYHSTEGNSHRDAGNEESQERLLKELEQISDVHLRKE